MFSGSDTSDTENGDTLLEMSVILPILFRA